jgi:hypothetical protein
MLNLEENNIQEIEKYLKQCSLVEKQLQKKFESLENSSTKIENVCSPFMEYVDGVNVCKTNVNLALDNISQIIHNIEQIDDIEAILKNKIIYSDYNLFLSTMIKAEQFRKSFDEQYIYFKDSFVLSKRLKESLKIACIECETLFLSYFKQYTNKSEEKESESLVKKINQLVETMEKCKYTKYFEKYEECRTLELSEEIESFILKVKNIWYTNIKSSDNYRKDSHYLIKLIPLITELLSSEKQLTKKLFSCVGNLGMKLDKLINPPLQQLSDRIQVFCNLSPTFSSSLSNTSNPSNTYTNYNPQNQIVQALITANLIQTLQIYLPPLTHILLPNSPMFIQLNTQLQHLYAAIHAYFKSWSLFIRNSLPKVTNEHIQQLTTDTLNFLLQIDAYPLVYAALRKRMQYQYHDAPFNQIVLNLAHKLELLGKGLKNNVVQAIYMVNNLSFIVSKLSPVVRYEPSSQIQEQDLQKEKEREDESKENDSLFQNEGLIEFKTLKEIDQNIDVWLGNYARFR